MQHRSMNPSALLLIVLTAGAAAMVRSHPANTPAMQFWEHALPGTPMPEAIANLVQKGNVLVFANDQMYTLHGKISNLFIGLILMCPAGINHSPLVEHYTRHTESGRSRHLLPRGTAPSGQHHDPLLEAPPIC